MDRPSMILRNFSCLIWSSFSPTKRISVTYLSKLWPFLEAPWITAANAIWKKKTDEPFSLWGCANYYHYVKTTCLTTIRLYNCSVYRQWGSRGVNNSLGSREDNNPLKGSLEPHWESTFYTTFFSLVFWSKRWHHKDILKLTDL